MVGASDFVCSTYMCTYAQFGGHLFSGTYLTITCNRSCSWLCFGMYMQIFGVYISMYHVMHGAIFGLW